MHRLERGTRVDRHIQFDVTGHSAPCSLDSSLLCVLPCRSSSSFIDSAQAPRPDRSAEQYLLEAFRVFDKNEDGLIPENDIRVIFTTLGEQVEVTDINQLLKQVTVDSNGKVKYSDFIKIILK
jgi:hypothetical protein